MGGPCDLLSSPLQLQVEIPPVVGVPECWQSAVVATLSMTPYALDW